MDIQHIAYAKCSKLIAVIDGVLLCFIVACNRLARYGMYHGPSAQVTETKQHGTNTSSVTTGRVITSLEWKKTFEKLIKSLEKYGPNHKPNLKLDLYYAIYKHDKEKLEYLLERVKNDPYKNSIINDTISGITPLHLAVYLGFKEGIALLMDNDANAQCRMKEEQSKIQAIHIAASRGSVSAIQLLLGCKNKNKKFLATVDAIDAAGRIALHYAAISGHTSCLTELLRAGSDPNCRDDMNNTPLCLAFRYKSVESIKNLIEARSDADCQYCHMNSDQLIRLLATFKYPDPIGIIVSQLRDSLKLDQEDSQGVTLLEHTMRMLDTDCLEALLYLKGGFNYQDGSGNTLLHIAAEKNIADIIPRLVQLGVKINVNAEMESPLHWAAINGHLEVLERLLSIEGIKVNAKDNNGNTPFHWAAANGHLELVDRILSVKGINVNEKDNNDNAALHWATANGHSEVVERLLSVEGININAKDNNGNTPLHWAAANGHLKVVKKLLSVEGISVNEKNKQGKTPFYYAKENKHGECMRAIANRRQMTELFEITRSHSLDKLPKI